MNNMKDEKREHRVGDPVNDKYILKGRRIVKCDDVIEWGKWFDEADNVKIARTTLSKDGERFDVSTVFLGLERGSCEGKPILFESMAFGGPDDGMQRRCCTYKEAEEQHLELLDHYKAKHWSIEK